jgi:hypothetical protein
MRPGHSEYNKLKRTELKEKTAVGAKVKKERGSEGRISEHRKIRS